MDTLDFWMNGIPSEYMSEDMLETFIYQNLTTVLPELIANVEARNETYFRNLLESPLPSIARKSLLHYLVDNNLPVWTYPLTPTERHEIVSRIIVSIFVEYQDDKTKILGKIRDMPISENILSAALYYRCPKEVIQWLLNHRLDVNQDDGIVGSALMWACRTGFNNQPPNHEILQLLLDHSANPLQTCRGRSVLSWCDDLSAMDIVYTNVHQLDAELRQTIRGRSYREYDPARVRKLIELGANINLNMETSYDENITPLMYAAHNGRAQVIRLLLELGADKNIRAVADDKDSRAYTFYLNFLTRAKRHDWDTLELLE